MHNKLEPGIDTITLTAAALQALLPNIQYWITRQGLMVSTGQAAITNIAVTQPPDQAVFDLSLDQSVAMYIEHGALTNEVGGAITAAELTPDATANQVSGDVQQSGPRVIGTPAPQTQALAATAEHLRKDWVTPYTGQRLCKVAFAITFSTVPTAGTGIALKLRGVRDGIFTRG